MRNPGEIRKIRFGLRLKFSLILIAAITFASVLIALAVFNQHERKVRETMLTMGGTILGGASENTGRYLAAKDILDSEKAADMKDARKKYHEDLLKKSRKEMEQYFSSIVKNEPILDIAFLIENSWKDVSSDWDRRDHALYRYFNRYTGTMEEFFLYYRNGKPVPGSRGRDDAQLKPTVYKYFMNSISLEPFLAFAGARREEAERFVIVAMPVFDSRNDEKLYRGYLEAEKRRPAKKEEFVLREKERERYRRIFLERLITGGMGLDYFLRPDTEKKRRALYYFIPRTFSYSGLSPVQRREIVSDFNKMLEEKLSGGRISLSTMKEIISTLQRRYSLEYPEKYSQEKTWLAFYYFLKRNGIDTDAGLSLGELAMASYRHDLKGILGLFLRRSEFHEGMQRDRNEVINIIISILLRCIIIALFFPTFIIRSLSRLAGGAYEIGKGNFDRRIHLDGSDELGRLADIFNIMASNLDTAQKEMLIKQRMEEELKTAEQIQAALLPAELPAMTGVEFGSYYSAQTEAGGDYYDVIKLDDGKLGIAMADVSGHGVGSGLVMAMVRTLLHTHCRQGESPKKVMEIINQYLKENTAANYFVTMNYGIMDVEAGTVRYTSAGHNQSIILRQGEVRELPGGGIALGVTSNETFSPLVQVHRAQLKKGEYLVQFTDGVDEAMNSAGEEFGLERFHRVLSENYGKSPSDMIKAVVAAIEDFTGKIPQHDDITMLIIRIL